MKIGFVDVGGGTRGIYGAGVFDKFLEEGITCDYFIGVSAGAANGASFLAGQVYRNYRFYNDYAFRKDYMSLRNFIKDGSYINLEYIYSYLTNSDGGIADPIPYKRALKAGCDKLVVILTRPKNDFRLPKDDLRIYRLLKRSYPNTAEVCKKRADRYNKCLKEILKLEKENKLLIIAPRSIGRLKTLSQDHAQLDKLYHMGLEDAEYLVANKSFLYDR